MNTSVQDVIKRSFIETQRFAAENLPKLIGSLLLAFVMGCIIYFVYRRFYTGVVFSRSFAVTLVGMTVLTCMVTLAISTNVVISLGMVGALSIVRYLLYLFWAITSGITLGAGMFVLSVCAALIVILMIVVFYFRQESGKVYIAVIHYKGLETGDAIVQAFGKMKFFIKSRTMRKDGSIEAAIEVFCKSQNDFLFMEKIQALEDVEDVTLIQYNGEYHG